MSETPESPAEFEQMKVNYQTFGSAESTAYLDIELTTDLYSGIDKHTDNPVIVRWSPEDEVYREVLFEEIDQKEAAIDAEVKAFAEMLEKEPEPYECPRCEKVLPKGIESLMEHSKEGGECDMARDLAEEDQYEYAMLTKRNLKEISKRSGKTLPELEIMRKTLLAMGHGMKIKYKVVNP